MPGHVTPGILNSKYAPRIPPSSSKGASAVIQNASCSKPVGSILTMLSFSPAFLVRSAIESTMPSASNGLPLILSVASWALRVSTAPFRCTTRSPIFTSLSLFMSAAAPAVGVHVKNDPGSIVALGCFHRAPQERQERRRNFAVQRHHDYIAFVNRFTERSRTSDADKTSDTNADRAHLHVFN